MHQDLQSREWYKQMNDLDGMIGSNEYYFHLAAKIERCARMFKQAQYPVVVQDLTEDQKILRKKHVEALYRCVQDVSAS
jgi:hypothetical protein